MRTAARVITNRKVCSDEEFIALFNKLKSPSKVASALGISDRRVYERRRFLEAKKNIALTTTDGLIKIDHPARQQIYLKDGVVFVGSDAHYWPDVVTTAHRTFVCFCKELSPRVVVLNGDVIDGSSISRWPRIGWDRRPSVKKELEAADARVSEIEDATKGAKRFWPLGNHDARFETFLAAHAPEYEGVEGFTLKDRFPLWKPCWSLFINDDIVVKHRFKGGIHATHNNTVWAGRTMVTGHLHSLDVRRFSDYNGTRYGVDSGTLAEPTGDQFVDYTEDNPKNWRSGFAILTVHGGKLMPPELVEVIGEGKVWFRGAEHKV